MTTETTPDRHIIRCPEDLLALVPVLAGFHPEESLVLLSLDGGLPPFARVDLPLAPRDRREVSRMLCHAVAHHRVRQVALLAYTARAHSARPALRTLRTGLETSGVEVLETMTTDGERWRALSPTGVFGPATPYDVSAHPITVAAIFRGEVVLPDRAALAARLDPDDAAVERTREAVAALGPGGAADAPWVDALVGEHLESGEPLSVGELARLLLTLYDVPARDAAWLRPARSQGGAAVDLWLDVVRRTPLEHLAAPAAILGWAAWLTGRGALAWCALDRSALADPHLSLARLLADGLQSAIPPTTWDDFHRLMVVPGRDAG